MTGARREGLAGAALVDEVRAGLAWLPDEASAVLALSGGPDSAGLALLVAASRPDLVLTAFHVRHGLRDDRADEAAARAQAAALGLAITVRRVTVAATGEGTEAAARSVRYDALRAAAREARRGAARAGAVSPAAGVLTGHTADDQAETVLLAIGRGTGTRGLGGMRAVRDDDGVPLGRPLLRVRRDDVRAAVAAAGLPTVTDPTNADDRLRRVRARTTVLPALAGLAGDRGDPVGVLARLADLARADDDFLHGLAAAEHDRLLQTWGGVRLLPAGAVDALPLALRGRVVHAALAGVRGDARGVRAADVDHVLALEPGARVSVVDGVDAARDAHWLTLAPAGVAALAPRRVPSAGGVGLDELGIALRTDGRARSVVVPPWARGPGHDRPAALPPAPPGGWLVRGPLPGDRLADGRRLSAALSAGRVPRAVRPLVPVLVPAAGGPVVWVAGLRLREDAPAKGAERSLGGVTLVPLPS